MKSVSVLSVLVLGVGPLPLQTGMRAATAPLSASVVIEGGKSVTDDGQGAYVDGSSGVIAFVDGRDGGTFYLQFAPTSRRAFSVALTDQADSTVVPRRGVVRVMPARLPRSRSMTFSRSPSGVRRSDGATSATQWIVQNQPVSGGDVSSLRWATLPSDYPHGNGWTFLGHAHFHTTVRLTITLHNTP
jgi:hypothetical protein